ncbi:saccharopine dehydrogenase [uncultured Boseongicola sp.]|uniref:saccharopine dehydrogenase n=1 Tax=uncultured Boseongicola sp. TaxID=1648499 RepID=UPI00263818BE|nr:saccharopine dehydrogenase [uncultured Boseongicola sp.]
MTHFWVRQEPRANEARAGVMPEGVEALMAAGHQVTVEDDPGRAIPTDAYRATGAAIAVAGAWVDAPVDAVICGLKELPDDGTPLRHRHIMFGHAYKGQAEGAVLLDRFRAGGGTLLDLEYLTDPSGRRVAAFGVWAGFAGAAVSLIGWAAGQSGGTCPKAQVFASADAMTSHVREALQKKTPSVIVIGALGRVGTGARDLCDRLGLPVTAWDMAETASGGPFPEILTHDVFLNCILASPGVPVFVPVDAIRAERKLHMIGDIACDPSSDFSPIKVYDQITSWDAPTLRVHETPLLDVMAIDNLPSMLPREASEDFAGQLLPHLLAFKSDPEGVWTRAAEIYRSHTD